MSQWRKLAVLATAAVIASCGGAADGSNAGPTNPTGNTGGNNNQNSNVVMVTADNAYSPSTITVTAGATVTWQWNTCGGGSYGYGGDCVQHSVSFDDGSGLASPIQDTGTYSRTFTAAGTYRYHCLIHGSAMTGVVIVK